MMGENAQGEEAEARKCCNLLCRLRSFCSTFSSRDTWGREAIGYIDMGAEGEVNGASEEEEENGTMCYAGCW